MEDTGVMNNEINTENTQATDVVVNVPKKAKRRFKKGTVALRQIREYQKSTDLLLPKASFRRIVNDMVKEIAPEINIRFSKTSIDAIQEACETHVTNTLRRANNNCVRSGRSTILKRDMMQDCDMY